MLKFFTVGIWCSPLLFANIYIIYSPTFLCLADLSPDHCAIIELSAITKVNHIPTDRLISCNDIFQMISCLMIVRWSHDGQAKVC